MSNLKKGPRKLWRAEYSIADRTVLSVPTAQYRGGVMREALRLVDFILQSPLRHAGLYLDAHTYNSGLKL